MTPLNGLILACLVYAAALFVVAFIADRAARIGGARWLRSPLVFTLSLSVYCTAWTFYGAVGFAARSGLEFLTIYLGPTIIMVGWWGLLRKLVRVGRANRVTSIADLISSRYGKSSALAAMITLMAVAGTTPYIALQLQSVTLSFAAFDSGVREGSQSFGSTVIWVAVGLAAFAILFGTRNLDVNERHHGVVTAIALEAIVKLVALLAVGGFVVWGVADGIGDVINRLEQSEISSWEVAPSRWLGLTVLSAAAFLCLPRMFQVMVVENEDENHLAFASWAFPLYLMLMSLCVVPIAVLGLSHLPTHENPDLFVLTLPLSEGRTGLAILSFLGGFSSATSMVIVATIALSTMVSNHIVMPLWLRFKDDRAHISGDVRHVVLLSRRLAIIGILSLGYLYYRLSGGGAALASIGLIAFAGVAQLLPALIGGLFWRGATRIGAIVGMALGFGIWLWALFLPSFGPDVIIPREVFDNGPWGVDWLQPNALFGIGGLDPVVHAVFWSLLLNSSFFVAVSLISFASPIERLQGAQMVNVFQHSTSGPRWSGGFTQSEDLMVMTQRILGAEEARAFFKDAAEGQGLDGNLPEPTAEFLNHLERRLAGSIGGAASHAMVSQIVGGAAVSVEDLIAVADEAAQILEYSSQLEVKSEQLTRTARQLEAANDKLTQISHQKDAFLGQVSHELRTPMTSIRSFSEILRDAGELKSAEVTRYSSIIHDESIRLTRLLDDLLDFSVLESGHVVLNVEESLLSNVIDRSIAAVGFTGRLRLLRDREKEAIRIKTDIDRLTQVFINLMSNAEKYCVSEVPELRISVSQAEKIHIDFVDSGPEIARERQEVMFEKFARGEGEVEAGAGLGLAISREVMERLGGTLVYLPEQGGAAFRVSLPL